MTEIRTQTGSRTRVALSKKLTRYGSFLLRAPLVLLHLRRRFGTALRVGTLHRVAIYPGLGVAYNRVKKNANTTLTLLFRELAGEGETHRDQAKWEALTPFDLSAEQRAELDRLCWIVVVRNPYSRVLSAFLDKFREEKYQKAYGNFDLSPEGFAAFVTWLEQGGLSKDGHWDLQTKLIVGPVSKFDAVIRFETLGADLERALTRAQVPFDAGKLRKAYPSDEGKKTGASDRMPAFYTPDLATRVARLYARDFTALGYDTAFPEGDPLTP